MKITARKNIEKISLPLPIYHAIHLADTVNKDGDNFIIIVGIDEKLISQLKILSMDSSDMELQKNTSDFKRFGLGKYEDWYKKNRTPFVLVHRDTNALAALVWFGPEPLRLREGNWHTVAWRSYPSFRGKGMTGDFTKFVFDFYIKQVSKVKISAIIKKGNSGSIRLAKSLGFKELLETPGKETLIMVKE